MPQQDVSIRTNDGECSASLHIPTGAGPWPGVIMYPDAAGSRDTFAGAGVEYVMETYPAGHGFAVPDNLTYDPNAEQRHWEALAQLFSKLPR